MPTTATITSIDNPRIAGVCKLRKSRERRASGLFVAEGWREVVRAFAAGLACDQLYFSRALAGDAAVLSSLLDEAVARGVQPWDVAAAPFRKMSYRDQPEGVLGVFAQPRWSLEDLPAIDRGLWLVAVGTGKPGNLGAMARTAASAGVCGMLAVDGDVDIFNPNAIRASTCAVYTLPVAACDTAEAIEFLRGRGIQIVATSPQGERSYDEADLTAAVAIVIGPEDQGLDERWLEAARRDGLIVSIDMPGAAKSGVDSLNASNTAAIMLFEAARQRRQHGNVL